MLPDDALLLQGPCGLTYAGGVEQVDGGVTIQSSDPGEENRASSLKLTGLGDGHQTVTALALASWAEL